LHVIDSERIRATSPAEKHSARGSPRSGNETPGTRKPVAGRSQINCAVRAILTDHKGAVAFLTRFARYNVDTANLREQGTAMTPEQQCLQRFLASLRLHLHPSIIEITNPAIEAQTVGLGAGAVSVTYTLNPPANEQPETMDHG
jgi:hypothetical protein